VASAECDAIFPNQFPAVLRIRMRGGQVHEARVLANRGGPDNPLSVEELTVKFMSNATRVIAPGQAHLLAESIVTMADRPLSSVMMIAARAGELAVR
jgi:2-methylcitrate dehydratase PrpD